MEKDHVVISLETYEKLKSDKKVAEKSLQEAEYKLSRATKMIGDVMVSASKTHLYSPHPCESNAHVIFTEAGYTCNIETNGGTVSCGKGKELIILTKK